MEDQGLIPTREAARLLGLAPRTLVIWRTRGEGPRFVKLGAAVRYAREDLAEFVERRKRIRAESAIASATARSVTAEHGGGDD